MTGYTLINPSTEAEMETIPHSTPADLDAAVKRAKLAQRHWAALAPLDKARTLRAFAAAVEADRANLAALEIRNSGHPLSQSLGRQTTSEMCSTTTRAHQNG